MYCCNSASPSLRWSAAVLKLICICDQAKQPHVLIDEPMDLNWVLLGTFSIGIRSLHAVQKNTAVKHYEKL